MLTGNLSLSDFEVERAAERPETAEKMIVKLRAGMMPAPGAPRPSPDTLLALVETLERLIDEAAAADPNPGVRRFQTMTRAEYAQGDPKPSRTRGGPGTMAPGGHLPGQLRQHVERPGTLGDSGRVLPQGGDRDQSVGLGQPTGALGFEQVHEPGRGLAARVGPHRRARPLAPEVGWS